VAEEGQDSSLVLVVQVEQVLQMELLEMEVQVEEVQQERQMEVEEDLEPLVVLEKLLEDVHMEMFNWYHFQAVQLAQGVVLITTAVLMMALVEVVEAVALY
jgi:hypothetical protein